MGDTEMRVRLEKFSDIALSGWKFGAYERVDNFGDVIRPGRGNVNIIDFLEIHDNFYEIGGRMAEIHKKLNGAVAIIALQKNSNTEVGLGGFRGLEKPRLYLTMSRNNICRIVKAKNWADPLKNPNGLECRYRIHAGCNLSMSTGWARPAPKGA